MERNPFSAKNKNFSAKGLLKGFLKERISQQRISAFLCFFFFFFFAKNFSANNLSKEILSQQSSC